MLFSLFDQRKSRGSKHIPRGGSRNVVRGCDAMGGALRRHLADKGLRQEVQGAETVSRVVLIGILAISNSPLNAFFLTDHLQQLIPPISHQEEPNENEFPESEKLKMVLSVFFVSEI